jgi:hypothetical protein
MRLNKIKFYVLDISIHVAFIIMSVTISLAYRGDTSAMSIDINMLTTILDVLQWVGIIQASICSLCTVYMICELPVITNKICNFVPSIATGIIKILLKFIFVAFGII